MSFLEAVAEKWNAFYEKAKPVIDKIQSVLVKIGGTLRTVWRHAVRFRKILLTIPVALGAIFMAIYNMSKLPDVVGLNLQTDGTFALQIDRFSVVMGPLAITGLCLALMFCSKRTLTPWMVSVFSLALPVIILVTNIFPA